MRNRKLLYVLIPLIILVLILIAGVVYLKLNSSPEKIFANSISKVFEMFETTEKQYTTMKGTMNFSVDFENENTELTNTDIENTQTENANMESTGTYSDLIGKVNEANQSQNVDTNDISNMVNGVYTEIYKMLEASSIGLNMEIDTENMIINENINVIYDNEKFIDATILMQDEKAYLYLPDWLNKYLEIPEGEADFAELTESYKKSATLDINGLVEAIKEELIAAISAQELVQEETTLVLDGQETKVTASILSLKNDEIESFRKGFLTNLKTNEKFQVALGDYKEDVILMIDEMLNETEGTSYQKIEINQEIRLLIYTKGFLNEFVGISAETTLNSISRGFELLKHNKGKYELRTYRIHKEIRVDGVDLILENNQESKNKGTTTITMTAGEEQLVLVYNYEKQGKQTNFEISTIIDDTNYKFTGKIIEDDKKYEGEVIASFELEDIGKINAKYEFNFVFDEQVQKVDVGNSVLIDELSEEDQEEFIANLENSKLYQVIQSMLPESSFDYANEAVNKVQNSIKKPIVIENAYIVKYNLLDGFKASDDNTQNMKMYTDENFNTIYVTINYDSVDTYMNDLDHSYVLRSDYYENQKISDAKTYTVNGKEYKFRTITYNDEYGTYVDLYFAYEIDDKYCYVVEVESEGGNISMKDINKFLDITVYVDTLGDVVNEGQVSVRDKTNIDGVWYNSIDDYINSTSMQ